MPRTDAPFDPATFDFGPLRPFRPQAGVSPESLYGYYELERSEQFATEQATALHRDFVISWYRLLNGYYRALDVPSVMLEDDVWVTTWRILRLGLTAAKGALDATLAGYYVGAFGDIRQMAEYFFGLEYLNMKPSTVSGFYLTETGKKPEPLPHMGKRIEFVLNALAPGGTHPDATYLGFARMVRRTYQRMSDGHHLDGLAIVQTGHPDSSRYDLGATYHPSLAKEALDHGTLMNGTLALTAAKHMADLNPLSDDLCAEIDAAMHDAIAQIPLRDDLPDRTTAE
ncbi:MAG TPA: hypothetical protein VKB01_00415 [Thermomicrobiales bacterium]|nr:hypothetical protein [Thermomicrobiales bacterium]